MKDKKMKEAFELSKIATQEVMNPQYEITRQFLDSNEILYENNQPVIADIIINEDNKSAYVYFPIKGEQFYLVINLDITSKPKISSMHASSGNRVYFFANSDVHKAIELIQSLEIEPTEAFSMGDHLSHGRIAKFSSISVELRTKTTGEVEDKLKALIEKLLPLKANIMGLADTICYGINIVYYGYKSQMSGIHLDSETISHLAELKISVDIDLYASGKDLSD